MRRERQRRDAQHAERLLSTFAGAAGLSGAARRSYLDVACMSEPTLRDEVEALLAADQSAAADGFLDHAAPAASLDVAAGSAGDHEGRELGPYTILRLLGRGGMGSVYLARRADVDKQVAIKLIESRFAAPDTLRRFLLERTVLARLEHPHIARLLDAGVADDTCPYLVMEVVHGEPITTHAAGVGLEDQVWLFERCARRSPTRTSSSSSIATSSRRTFWSMGRAR